MNNQMSNELKAFMEQKNQTTQALIKQTERNAWAITEQSETNILLLETLRNINKNGRDTNSHQSENENTPLHTPESKQRPTRPPFLRGEEQKDADELNFVSNKNDIIIEYSKIDPKLRR